MNQEISIPTYFIQNNHLLNQQWNKIKYEAIIKYIAANLPQYFDLSSSFYAYIHSSINKEDELIELQKKVNETILGQNIYTKEVADQAVTIGH